MPRDVKAHEHRFYQISLGGPLEPADFLCHGCGDKIVVHRNGKVEEIKAILCGQILECGHPCTRFKGHADDLRRYTRHDCAVRECQPKCEHGYTRYEYALHALDQIPCRFFDSIRL